MNDRNYFRIPSLRKYTLFLIIGLCIAGSLTAQVATDVVIAPGQQQPEIIADQWKQPAIKDRDSGQVYRMNYLRSIAFSSVAMAANLWATPNLIKAKKELTTAELQALNPNTFNDLDRWALRQNLKDREKINVLSDRILTVTTISAASLLLDKTIRKDWGRIVAMFCETSTLTFSIYSFSPFGPLFQDRVRPVSYYADQPLDVRMEGNARNSLYSGHVANAASASFFMVKVYSDYHQLRGKKYLLYGLATIPPLAVAYLRVKSLYHFPSDCLIGLVIGAACGIIVPETHRIKERSNLQLGVSTMSDDPGLALVWKFDNKKK